MLEVIVNQPDGESRLLEPSEMFEYDVGTVFQQYFHGKPDRTYYVNYGHNEPLLMVWYNDESKMWCLSQETKKSIKGLNPTVQAKVVENAKLTVNLEIM